MGKEELGPPKVETIVVSKSETGEPKRVVFLIPLSQERATLVIPEGVEVRPALSREERGQMERGEFEEKTMTNGAFSIEPGEFLAKDVENGKGGAVIKFNPNSHSHDLLKAA